MFYLLEETVNGIFDDAERVVWLPAMYPKTLLEPCFLVRKKLKVKALSTTDGPSQHLKEESSEAESKAVS